MKEETVSILIVDDEPDMVELLRRTVSKELGWRAITATSGALGLELARKDPPHIALLDIKMPDINGMELLERLKELEDPPTVVMITAYGVIELAVESIKRGAYDFIAKPFDYTRLVHTLRQAWEHRRLLKENLSLKGLLSKSEVFEEMVGSSLPMRAVFETIQVVAPTDATVLITGESGTGKELVAKAIHRISHRAKGPFVAVNCPALPENVLESELFGYTKGAFTDAKQDTKGLFQEAHGGTIFLDEIGDLAQSLQAKLLRVLQEKEIKPLGQSKPVRVDVRVLASTNRDLKGLMQKGQFREDLFYRLSVVHIHLPPLKERMEDIPILAQHFLVKYGKEVGRPGLRLSPEALKELLAYDWPGNVRELENRIQSAVILSRSQTIMPKDLFQARDTKANGWPLVYHLPYKEAKNVVLSHFNRTYLSRLLERHRGNVTRAAEACGLERQALQQLLRRFKVNRQEFAPRN